MAACPNCSADHGGVLRELEYKALIEEEVYYPTQRDYEAWMKDEGSHYTSHPERLYSGGLFSGLAARDELNRILDVLYGT